MNMGIWVRGPDLGQSEKVVWNRAANRTQSRGRAVGGRLYLTQERLVFEPNRVDAITGGSSWQAALGHIAGVSSQAPDGNAFSGGLRTRLRLDLADGSVELFVVNHLEDVVRTIRQATGHPG
jgi:hypothetical protein